MTKPSISISFFFLLFSFYHKELRLIPVNEVQEQFDLFWPWLNNPVRREENGGGRIRCRQGGGRARRWRGARALLTPPPPPRGPARRPQASGSRWSPRQLARTSRAARVPTIPAPHWPLGAARRSAARPPARTQKEPPQLPAGAGQKNLRRVLSDADTTKPKH